MDGSRRLQWATPATTYAPEHIENILNLIGVDISQETSTNFLCFCPFHDNTHTPSFSVDKATGRYICFNHACDNHGGLRKLVSKVTHRTIPETIRFILAAQQGHEVSYSERRARQSKENEWPSMPLELLERMEADLWRTPHALDYLVNKRGFTEETLKHFRMAYSVVQDMVFTPMFDVSGELLGGVGRSIEGKQFKNTFKLPRGKTLWNIHNAKKHSLGIVVEANFDGMSVHQAGFPGVVAVLGGHFSEEHADQLDRHFERIIIMTDDDEPAVYDDCKKCQNQNHESCIGHNAGRDLGEGIAAKMQARGKPVFWAMYDEQNRIIYPEKDANAMSNKEIQQCINNAISNFRYQQWKQTMV